MADADEYRCFVGSLSWNTTDRELKEAFSKFGHLIEAKVVLDKFSGRSRGFGFVSFDEKRDMEDAIKEMHGMDLDGRPITVERAQPNQGGSRDRDGDRDRDRGRDHGRERGFGGSRGSAGGGGGGGECFKCGKPGHFARECPSGDGGRDGGRYGGRDDRRGGGGGGGHYGSDRGGDRYGGGGGGDRYGGGGGGDRYGGGGGGGKYRESGSRGGSGSDRYGRDRSGPY